MKKRETDETTKERILDAAKKIFVAKGMAGARMQDIADEAGINKALLHYYFRNKEQLFQTILLEVSTRFFPSLNQIFDSDIPLFDKIRTFCSSYIDNVMKNPYIPMFVLNEMNQNQALFIKNLVKNNPPNPSKLVIQIEEEIKNGTINPVSPVQLLINMMSLCVFPFVSKPMLQLVIGLDDLQFRHVMELRKIEVAEFIINSIRK
jgi:TetR/AcrR family transcriptional regulator